MQVIDLLVFKGREELEVRSGCRGSRVSAAGVAIPISSLYSNIAGMRKKAGPICTGPPLLLAISKAVVGLILCFFGRGFPVQVWYGTRNCEAGEHTLHCMLLICPAIELLGLNLLYFDTE
jgi:hypothetical protein